MTDTAKGSFGATSFRNKTKILFAGVAMNALLAYVILIGLSWTGLPPVIQNQYSYGQPTYAQEKEVMAVGIAAGSPAEQAGIMRGDIILAANGQKLVSESDLLAFTKENSGEKVTLTVEQDGKVKDIQVQLRQPTSNEGALGVTPFQTYLLQYNFFDGIITATGITIQLAVGTIAAFGDLIAGLFTQGKVSEQVAGPVGIFVLLNNVLQFGLPYVLIFVVSISISLAVINAMPLPALDGGRWVMAAVQKISKRELSERTEGLIHTFGFVALIALMVVVTFFDIKRLG